MDKIAKLRAARAAALDELNAKAQGRDDFLEVAHGKAREGFQRRKIRTRSIASKPKVAELDTKIEATAKEYDAEISARP